MAKIMTTAPHGVAAPALDLTPMEAFRWHRPSIAGNPPTVLVNPAATFSQKAALACAMVADLQAVATLADVLANTDTSQACEALPLLSERLRQLAVVMDHLGQQAAAMEGAAP